MLTRWSMRNAGSRPTSPSGTADANRLLDRLEHLPGGLDVPEGPFHEIPPFRITRLRRQGERYFADGPRELPSIRRRQHRLDLSVFSSGSAAPSSNRPPLNHATASNRRTCRAPTGSRSAPPPAGRDLPVSIDEDGGESGNRLAERDRPVRTWTLTGNRAGGLAGGRDRLHADRDDADDRGR